MFQSNPRILTEKYMAEKILPEIAVIFSTILSELIIVIVQHLIFMTSLLNIIN